MDLRFAEQFEIGLEARRVGKADLAQRAQAKAGRHTDQVAHRLLGLIGMTETGASQSKNAIREHKVAVAFDRLAGMRDGFFGAAGEETSQRKSQRRVIDERLQRAQLQCFLGMLDGGVIGTANTSRQGIEAKDRGGVGY